jgi:hypothetical protein
MRNFALVITILALLVYSIGGLVPLSHAPHDHLLIGFVTAEQLRAHEAAESLGMQDLAEASVSASRSLDLAVTGTGGLIISVTPGLAGIVSVAHFEIVLLLAFLLFVSLVSCSVSTLRVLPQATTLPSPDPPPRRILVPI